MTGTDPARPAVVLDGQDLDRVVELAAAFDAAANDHERSLIASRILVRLELAGLPVPGGAR